MTVSRHGGQRPCGVDCACGRHKARVVSMETREKMRQAKLGVQKTHHATCRCFRCEYSIIPLDVRFNDKTVASEDGCHLWSGRVDRLGYGQFRVGEKIEKAHRYAFTRHYGTIPEGSEIDHLCRVRHCVNPMHLEAVTHTENMRRAAESGSLVEAQRNRRAREASQCR